METFYLNDRTEKLVPTSGGPAIFRGLNTNGPGAVNFSDADWVSGTVVLGNFGSVQFQTSAVNPGQSHRNYLVSVIPHLGGGTLTNLSAEVYGRDGFNRELTAPAHLTLPDPGTGTSTVQLFAPVAPNDGSSSLDPSVLQHFLNHDMENANRDLQARVRELNHGHLELINDQLGSVALETSIADVEEVLHALHGVSGLTFLSEVFPIIAAVNGFVGIAEGLYTIYVDSELRANVKQAAQRLESAWNVAEDLAAKTFVPERVVVSGTSDDFGFDLTTIGGPFHHYRNDFQFGANNQTSGTSVFTDSSGQVLATGSILTQNYYDSSGEVVYADSTLVLPTGQLYRYGSRTGPVTEIDDPNGDGNTTDSYSYFPAEFQFSPRSNSNGAFSQGLTGYSTTGNVTTTTAPDGRQAVLIKEHSPSSLATRATIPDAEVPLLVMNLTWPGQLDPHEDATFSARVYRCQLDQHAVVPGNCRQPGISRRPASQRRGACPRESARSDRRHSIHAQPIRYRRCQLAGHARRVHLCGSGQPAASARSHRRPGS